MTIIYTLGRGSIWEDNELRYSIRSMVQYGGATRVIVVGHKPEWYIGEHIEVKDTARKAYNIHLKTLAACEVADNFVQAADDHYLLAPCDWSAYYYKGTLAEGKYQGYYGQITQATHAALGGGKFFNLHVPMKMNATWYKATMAKYDWDKTDYLVKSLYANNLRQVNAVEMKDCKLRGHVRTYEIENFVEGRVFLSSDNVVPVDLKRWLVARYPTPSKWEK